MFCQYNIVAVVPAGRERHLRTLMPYLFDQFGYIDEYHLWVNTQNPSDLAYMDELVAEYGEEYLVKLVHRHEPWEPERHNVPRIRHFWKECMDPHTIYIRFDDDICWMHPESVRRLLHFRVNNPDPLLVYPAVINSGRTDHIHQIMGVTPDDLPAPWKLEIANHINLHREKPEMAAVFHEAFIHHLRTSNVDKLRFPMYRIDNYERVPINCISYFGRDIAAFNGEVASAETNWEEEWWITEIKAKELQRPSMICGDSLMAHYAFHNQRDYLDTHTNLHSIYELLSLNRDSRSYSFLP